MTSKQNVFPRKITAAQLGGNVKVHDFWNTEPCGSHFVKAEPGSAEFYRSYTEFRYQKEWHLPRLVPFTDARGKNVLEVGCGNGADGVRFAQAGARYTGIDLTEAAVTATRDHFRLLGLEGDFCQGNADQLAFPDASFDIVYSHGVLHHTPDPERSFAEVYRVLRPGGQAILMLYHKHSFNYYVRIMSYMRLRVVMRILARTGRLSEDRAQLGDKLRGIRGNQDPGIWDIHYQNFLRSGWSYLRARNFIHHATDGPECPYAFVYTTAQVQRVFCNFKKIRTKVAHFPLRSYPVGRGLPLLVEEKLAPLLGWYLFIYLEK